MQNPLFNPSFLKKKLAEYKAETKDNSAIFLKWHTDNQKEEALQTNFLNDIFGKVLGYEIDTGEAEFNLLTEYKTQKDGTKVDGVLGFITKDKKDIRIAIELKAKNTTNLDSVEKQAFEYRDKIDGIEWVITSNTNEIRLYSAGSGGRLKHQSWTFFELANSIQKQREFHFLLAKDRLFGAEKSTSPTHKLLEDNTKEEELIEKRFYNDYKDLRKKLFNHLREQNPTKEPTTLLSKTQKLLDRVIFVCFCEDLNLLPDKIFTKLLKTTQEAFVEITVWQQIKGLFNAIDKGYPQKNINKFNGGLFAKDIELDDLILQDDILKEIIKISDWDFGSELTVNILGHIFEQSITDLEEIKADISGETHDKKQGKRKKDGVFYTPEYITRYIVEEAVGGWLNDRKTELGIENLPELTDEDLVKKSKKPSKKAQIHIDFWNSYAKTLQSIKVLDPACGSGAFLVAVFNFLENEWLTLSETLRKLGDDEQAGLFSYSQVYKHILKNNIYGVDLNPESVQITKLSLWLKTANRSEELTTLDANIKCGNSLIDDATVETGFYINNEGERVSLAFNWQNEFSQVFGNSSAGGGFDVVVGNPPYVNVKYDIYSKYKTQKVGDLYVYFVERGLNLLKENSYLSFIIPSLFEKGMKYDIFRKYLLENTVILEIQNKGDKVFEEVQMPTSIVRFQKRKIPNQKWICNDDNIISKMEFNSVKVGEFTKIMRGLEIGKDIIDLKGDVKIISGEDISRYGVNSYGFISNKTFTEFQKDEYYFTGDRVLIRETGSRITATFTNENLQSTRSLYSIKSDTNNLYYLIAIINSKLIQFYYAKKFKTNTDIFPKIRIGQVRELPIPQLPPTQQTPFITYAQKMLEKTKELNEKTRNFLEYFTGKFGVEKPSKKLQKWHELDFAEFCAEVGKKGRKLTMKEEMELKPLFDEKKKECVTLQSQITRTDAEIDRMVYALYGLSEEEIGVVENLVV